MQDKVNNYVSAFSKSFYFTAAMGALLWLAINYAAANAMTLILAMLAAGYSILAIVAGVNLARGDRLFVGSPSYVLRPVTQRLLRLSGIALAIPALMYVSCFAYFVTAFNHGDRSVTAYDRLDLIENLETTLFGKSIVWSFILGACSNQEIDFGPYMADLQRRIKRQWFPPKDSESRRVVVAFKLSRSGQVSNLRLARSSGLASADKAAVQAIENARLSRLPLGSPRDVDIQFTLDYNVFSSASNDPM